MGTHSFQFQSHKNPFKLLEGKNSACRDFQTVQNGFSYFSYDFLNHLIAKNQFSIIGVCQGKVICQNSAVIELIIIIFSFSACLK
nr:MAG TPA_asm: hypothetical protein [Caudoviricetes sp.]